MQQKKILYKNQQIKIFDFYEIRHFYPFATASQGGRGWGEEGRRNICVSPINVDKRDFIRGLSTELSTVQPRDIQHFLAQQLKRGVAGQA